MPVVDGVWTAPERALVKDLPGQPSIGKPIKGKGGKDLWRVGDLRRIIETPIHQLCLAKGISMDIEETSVEVSGKAEEALASLKVAVDKFRGHIAGDLTSIKAASSRIQTEALQIKQVYQATASMLTSEDFVAAVANAERMAVALRAISELSDTKLSVAVFSGGRIL